MKSRPSNRRPIELAPSASRLTESLRDIGYDFESAIADLVDNSVTAGARNVSIRLQFDEHRSWIAIVDDGHGMSERELVEGLRFGTRREYRDGDLGRFGLGLKTASISQCRQVRVFSRRAKQYRRISGLTLDLDHVAATDRWELTPPSRDRLTNLALECLQDHPGTVVLWTDLDRIIDMSRASSGWNRRRLETNAAKVSSHLGMVFHRFLEGSVAGRDQLAIYVNGSAVEPWNPFAPDQSTEQLQTLQLNSGDNLTVEVNRYVLPARHEFSDQQAFEHLGGPNKWNRQQGFYVYRADRMIQSGGWCGMRAADEHTKLARLSIDFATAADSEFKIDVSKMRVSLPGQIRSLLTDPIAELVAKADRRYRHRTSKGEDSSARDSGHARLGEVGASLVVAALDENLTDELDRIMKRLGVEEPTLARELGW